MSNAKKLAIDTPPVCTCSPPEFPAGGKTLIILPGKRVKRTGDEDD